MKAMILAAGRGKRMRPLTDHTPKPLLMAGGKPLIQHQIERLAAAGFRDLVINHAHLGKQIEAPRRRLALGSRIRYSAEGQALETGGGIFRPSPCLGPGPFLVVNGDVWTDLDLDACPGGGRPGPPGAGREPEHHPAGTSPWSRRPRAHDGEPRLTFGGIGLYHPELFTGCQGGAFPLAPLLRAAMGQDRSAASSTGVMVRHRHPGAARRARSVAEERPAQPGRAGTKKPGRRFCSLSSYS
jgi:N-acetyl-alpha-D-muramate 1-phosphate uridylyltransferase